MGIDDFDFDEDLFGDDDDFEDDDDLGFEDDDDEYGLGDFDEFGVELGLQDSVLFDRSLLGDLVTTVNSTSASTPSGIITDTNEIVQAASNIPGFLFNDTGPLGNSGSDQSLATAGRVG